MIVLRSKLFILTVGLLAGAAVPSSVGVQAASNCELVSASFVLNGGASVAASRELSVEVTGDSVEEYIISETFSLSDATFQPMPEGGTFTFTLSEGDGAKTVYMMFKNGCSQTQTMAASITLEEVILPPAEAPSVGTEPEACGEGEECVSLTYKLYLVNPDGEERTMEEHARKTEESDTVTLLGFEDRTDGDFNDVVVRIDRTDRTNPEIQVTSVEARLDHKVGVRFFSAGTMYGEQILAQSSHESVGVKMALGDLANSLYAAWLASVALAPKAEEEALPAEAV